MSLDLSNLKYISQMQTDAISQATQAARSAGKTTGSQSVTDEGTEASGTALFAQALSEEISNLTQQSEAGSVLERAASFGVTTNLNDLSEMMQSESGRGAINAMADSALTSIVFGSSEQDNNSGLDSLLESDTSSTEQIVDALQNILDSLEATDTN